MSQDFRKYIQMAYENDLNLASTKEVFTLIMNGDVDEIQISSFLSLLQKSKIKPHHIIGALEVMKSKMIKVNSDFELMDTCGTGGDGKNSLNISTATAFVLTAMGIKIAKHGNRALTSKCGSADVLMKLNINIDMNLSKFERCIDEVGICFMFAPNHHPAMKYVGSVRKLIGIRTIFNMLGPLLNPASVKNQLVGVYSEDVFNLYKDVFKNDPKKNVCLISGFDGNDEISLDGSNLIFIKDCDTFEFDPITLDIPRSNKKELLGGDSKFNSERIIELFKGKKDSFYYAVCINAAFGVLLHQGKKPIKENIFEAYNAAKSIIKDGAPLEVIKKLSKFSNS